LRDSFTVVLIVCHRRCFVDDEAKQVFEALEYDVSKVEKDFKHSTNFFYMTPGVKWCRKDEKLCASAAVPWGVFTADKWLWGVVLGTEKHF